ncbi:MAG: hypothetical protein LUF29_06060 [Oscillospiraceae bacterium]|nr:hypothetical protein [Oscillospiraceae bacterium]
MVGVFFITHRSALYQRFGGIISGGTQQVDSVEKYSSEDFGITEYVSSVDHDGDGIDDQTDILEHRDDIVGHFRIS